MSSFSSLKTFSCCDFHFNGTSFFIINRSGATLFAKFLMNLEMYSQSPRNQRSWYLPSGKGASKIARTRSSLGVIPSGVIVHRCLPEFTLVFIHDETAMAKFRQDNYENLVMLSLTVRVYENVILKVANTFDVHEDRVHHTLKW